MVMQFSWVGGKGKCFSGLVVDLGLKGIFMPVLRFAARRAPGGRIAQQFVCPASAARQSASQSVVKADPPAASRCAAQQCRPSA
jgi:hypothetical protein